MTLKRQTDVDSESEGQRSPGRSVCPVTATADSIDLLSALLNRRHYPAHHKREPGTDNYSKQPGTSQIYHTCVRQD